MHDAKVRIFVSSPSDVDHERALLKEICERLRQEYLSYFEVQAVLWEEEALTADRNFQDGILRPADCDIVVVVLWTRLGTPLPDEPYGGMTGTQWEFVNAVEASARAGQPEVLVYKKTRPKLVDITNAEATQEALEDRRRLEAFFRENFFNADESFRRAFRTFEDDAGFRDLVEGQLRKLLNRRISAEKRAITGVGDWRGSPFRPSGPYGLGDARIFTGRESEAREILARLPGRPFLLLSGPSGCGKTSLICAGVLPRLARPFLVEGVAGCRVALVDPSPGPDADPLAALAAGLCARTALGETLLGFGLDQVSLARLLASEPTAAAAQVAAALDLLGREQRGRTGVAEGELRLALVLDPLDRLLAGEPGQGEGTPGTREILVAAVGALAATGRVWVIGVLGTAGLRHLHPLLPLLAAAAGQSPIEGPDHEVPPVFDPDAWYRLDPPAPVRVRQVVEIPTRVAGIELEGHVPGAERSLVDLLEAEAAGLPHWPPLVETTLETMYQVGLARGASPVLGAADYRASGGMAGAVLARAEGVWAGLGPEARAALPMLCRALISMDGTRAMLRAGDLTLLEADPGCHALLNALVAARLVVLDAERDAQAHAPCPRVDYSMGAYLRSALRETSAHWRARLTPSRLRAARALDDLSGEPASAPAIGEDAPAAQPPSGAQAAIGITHDWTDWDDWRPRASFVHSVLLSGWAPVRDWLANAGNRETLQLRYHVSRRALLWRRTDCNREHLLGRSGFAAARGLSESLGGEVEPLEAEYLAQSELNLRFEHRRNRALRILGATLVVLLVLATGAAIWALDASQKVRVALHRSLLAAADTDIARGNTPGALMNALAAAPYLPQEATDTLSRVLVGNRLIAMAQGGPEAAPSPGRTSVSPVFSDDGEQLLTADGQAGVDLWRLWEGRLKFETNLAPPGFPVFDLAFVGLGAEAKPVAVGPGGVWWLPATLGTAPDFPCAIGAEDSAPLIALDPTGRHLAIAHAIAPDAAEATSGDAAPVQDGNREGRVSPQRYGVCVLDLSGPGEVLMDLPLHDGEILGLDFDAGGQRLVTASTDGTARVLDLASRSEVLRLPPEGKLRRSINRAVFDPAADHGGRIALACADSQVRVYAGDGTLVVSLQDIHNGDKTVKVHTSAVHDVDYSFDGRYLVAGDDDGQVVRWDPDHPDTAQVLGQHDLPVQQVRLAPPHGDADAEPLVLTASEDRTARLWGLYTGRDIAAFSQDAAVTDARFSTDGSRVLTSSDLDGSARVWGVHRIPGIGYRMAQPDHMGPVAFSPAPKALSKELGESAQIYAVAGHVGAVGVWFFDGADPGAGPARLWLLEGHTGRVRQLDFAPSGRWLASAAADGTARVWDLKRGSGCVLDAGGQGGAREVKQVLFGPDEDWLLTASDDRRRPVRLWDWDGVSCAPLDPDPAFDLGGARVQAAALTRAQDGAVLVATGDDAGRVRVMRRAADAQWQRICDLGSSGAGGAGAGVGAGAMFDLAFSPDGTWLAGVGEDPAVSLTRVGPTGCTAAPPLKGHSAAVYSVRFAPDGGSLVTASLDETARVWRTDGGLLATLAGHRARVKYAEFSPDGRWVLTGSRDGDLRLWRAPTEPRGVLDQPFLTIDAGLRGVTDAAFSPDGNQILAGYWANAAQLWRIWSEDAPNADLVALWGPERARLALSQEAERFRRDNRLDLRQAARSLSDLDP